MKNLFTKSTTYPLYFRTMGGVYAEVTGPAKFVKSFWSKDNKGKLSFGSELVELDTRTCAGLFAQNIWHKINKKQYGKHIEPIAAADRGIRSAKPIEFVFEHEGKQYFRYKKIEDMPAGRAQEMEAVFMEMNFMLDAKGIDRFFATMTGMLSGESGTIDLGALSSWVREHDARRKLGFDSNLWRKIGTVMFFTADEDTSGVDWEGGKEKLKAWKSLKDDFFLKTPLRHYLPFGAKSIEDSLLILQKAKAKLMLSNAILDNQSKSI